MREDLEPQLCRVSTSTFYRWLGGEKPPAHRLERLASFFQSAGEPSSDSIISGNRQLPLRTSEQVLERQVRCKRCWVIKNALPYLAAIPGISMDALFDFISKMKDDDAFHCIFYASEREFDGPISPYAAYESFREFKYRLWKFVKYDEAKYSRLHGWLVRSPERAFELGLTDNYLGGNILEYDPDKTRDLPHLATRTVDILIEIPLAVYLPGDGSKMRSDEESRWIEMAPRRAESYWGEKKQMLLDLAGGVFNKSGEVKEVMTQTAKFESYVRKSHR